jgi:predicted dehydrogenase
MTSPSTNRRDFLKQSAVLAAPLVIPATALGREGRAAASERIVLGVIGTGGRGRSLTNAFLSQPDVQVVAVCDVDEKHLKAGQQIVHKKYGNTDCRAYKDFRELLRHRGLNAVVVATPDHWHALASIAAANAKLDVYCEKPLANSVAEGRAICEAVRRNNVVLQTGSHERSNSNGRFACELVRNGKIGRLHTVRINLPCTDPHHKAVRATLKVPPVMPVPAGFDYDFWLGHTPAVPYTEKRCHFFWRFILAHGGGEMTDRGAHVIDIGHLGADVDATGPTEIEATGVRPKSNLFDVFWDYNFTATYSNGVKFVGTAEGPRGLKFEGSDGWVFVHIHGCRLEASSPALLKENPESFRIKLGRSPGHQRNFLDCVKSRLAPVATAEIGHRSASICHLLNIAMLTGRKLRWDPRREVFLGDEAANKLLRPTMRAPWKL